MTATTFYALNIYRNRINKSRAGAFRFVSTFKIFLTPYF
jgi:hypothetical protein